MLERRRLDDGIVLGEGQAVAEVRRRQVASPERLASAELGRGREAPTVELVDREAEVDQLLVEEVPGKAPSRFSVWRRKPVGPMTVSGRGR